MVEVGSLIDHFPYLGIFVLLVLGDIGFPFPEDATLLLSGFLIANDIIKLIPALLVLYPSLLGTDFFLYLIGKRYGRRVVEHKRFHRIISPERLSKLEEKFNRWGILVVFFGRHLLGLRAQVFLVAGVLRMSAIKFLVADAASAILTVAVMVGLGYWGWNSIQILKRDTKRIEYVIVVVIVLLLASFIIFKYFKNRSKLKGK